MPRFRGGGITRILEPRVRSEPVAGCRHADHNVPAHPLSHQPLLAHKRRLQARRSGSPQNRVNAADRPTRESGRGKTDVRVPGREALPHVTEAPVRPPGGAELADARRAPRHELRSPRSFSVARNSFTSSPARVGSMS